MLLSLSSLTFFCRLADATAAAIGTLPLPPLPPLPLVSVEDDACYTNANSSPTLSAHAVCRALKD
jgi:hypothetical protein